MDTHSEHKDGHDPGRGDTTSRTTSPGTTTARSDSDRPNGTTPKDQDSVRRKEAGETPPSPEECVRYNGTGALASEAFVPLHPSRRRHISSFGLTSFGFNLHGCNPQVQRFLELTFTSKDSDAARFARHVVRNEDLQRGSVLAKEGLFLSVEALTSLTLSFASFSQQTGNGSLRFQEARELMRTALTEGDRMYIVRDGEEDNGSGEYGYVLPLRRPDLLNKELTQQKGEVLPCTSVIHPKDVRLQEIAGFSPSDDERIAAHIRVGGKDHRVTHQALDAFVEATHSNLWLQSIVEDVISVRKPDRVEALHAFSVMLNDSQAISIRGAFFLSPNSRFPRLPYSYQINRDFLFEIESDKKTVSNFIFREPPDVRPDEERAPTGTPQAVWREQNPYFYSFLQATLSGKYGKRAAQMLTRVDEGIFFKRDDFRPLAALYRKHRTRGADGEILDRKLARMEILEICGGREVYHDTGARSLTGGAIIPYDPSPAERRVLRPLGGAFPDVPRHFDKRDIIFSQTPGLEPVTASERLEHRDAVAKFKINGDTFWVRSHALERYMEQGSCVSRRTALVRMYDHFRKAKRKRSVTRKADLERLGIESESAQVRRDYRWEFVVSSTPTGDRIMTCRIRKKDEPVSIEKHPPA